MLYKIDLEKLNKEFDHRDLIEKFEPLSEEEQKLLFWMILDSMEHYATLPVKERDKKEVISVYQTYQIFSSFFYASFVEKEMNIRLKNVLLEDAKKQYEEYLEKLNSKKS